MMRFVMLTLFLVIGTAMGSGRRSAAVGIARDYLGSTSAARLTQLSKELSRYDVEWDSVIKGLQPVPPVAEKLNRLISDRFRTPHLKRKHPDARLYYVIPGSYTNTVPNGLLIYLHGGNRSTQSDMPGIHMRFPRANEPRDAHLMADLFTRTGMIGVGPSAPVDPQDDWRWGVPGTEEYLTDVIEEVGRRYAVDPNRVFVLGYSMGGYGAYHVAQTQPDRYAGIIAVSGAWEAAHWPGLLGTDFCMVHGANDARHGFRSRYTDPTYPRLASRQMKAQKVPHTYLEHQWGHGFAEAKPHVLKHLLAVRDKHRDPFFPRVSLTTPIGNTISKFRFVQHRRWVSIDRIGYGKVRYDALPSMWGRIGLEQAESIEKWNAWTLPPYDHHGKGAAVRANHDGDNRFTVRTTNVKRLSLWLHPKMVDVSRPAVIRLDGKTRTVDIPKPSLAVALDSYKRCRDWGLIYPIRLRLSVD